MMTRFKTQGCLLLGLVVSGCPASHQVTDAGPDSRADVAIDRHADVAPDSSRGISCEQALSNPRDPGPCSTEGESCSIGSRCGAAVFCNCGGGTWSCGIGEPDPVCTCGREPEAGDPCINENQMCGSCCPSANQPAFGPFRCSGGRWQDEECVALACPTERLCPVDRQAFIGTPCGNFEARVCGAQCCNAPQIECGENGFWNEALPSDEQCDLIDCAEPRRCGPGTCNYDQACVTGCGAEEQPYFGCLPLAEGCRECGCAAVPSGSSCEMVEGAVHITLDPDCG